jgi:hypothetical protein
VLKPFSKKEKGQASIVHVVYVLLAVALVIAIIAGFNQFSTAYNTPIAIDFLTGQGYVVLAAEEYELLAKEATAYAAVANAELAVTAAETAAAKVDLFNTADTFLFPADTDYWVLLTADAAAGSWSTWAEIVDNNAVTLSSLFAADAGYISDIYVYQVTAAADTTHIVEIAYGASKISLTRIMFNGDNLNLAQIKSRRIPAGETIYYRIMTNVAPTEYVSIGFRYFYE